MFSIEFSYSIHDALKTTFLPNFFILWYVRSVSLCMFIFRYAFLVDNLLLLILDSDVGNNIIVRELFDLFFLQLICIYFFIIIINFTLCDLVVNIYK